MVELLLPVWVELVAELLLLLLLLRVRRVLEVRTHLIMVAAEPNMASHLHRVAVLLLLLHSHAHPHVGAHHRRLGKVLWCKLLGRVLLMLLMHARLLRAVKHAAASRKGKKKLRLLPPADCGRGAATSGSVSSSSSSWSPQ